MRRGAGYLVVWDKPGTRAAPGRFYREMRELEGGLRFIQRSVYGVEDLKSARKLADLARRYGLRVLIFRAEEIPIPRGVEPSKAIGGRGRHDQEDLGGEPS
jgi:hypothetical protein